MEDVVSAICVYLVKVQSPQFELIAVVKAHGYLLACKIEVYVARGPLTDAFAYAGAYQAAGCADILS